MPFIAGLPPRLERRSPNPVKRERESSQLQDESSSAEPERLHPCSYPNCDSRFKRYEHLKRHLRTHTRERPYVCSKCTRSFSRQDNLTSHARTHSRSDGGEDGTAARIPFS